MASCKECAHVEACNGILNGFNIDIEFFGEQVSVCKNFKDRSRFVELPFQIGDDVYCTGMVKIYKKIVKKIEVDDEGIAIVTEDGYCIDSTICFRSQKEAKQALKEREDNGH